MINNFDAANRLLNLQANNFKECLDLFFIDHEFVPLLIQENYLNTFGDRNNFEDLEKLANASDMISLGDLANIQIR